MRMGVIPEVGNIYPDLSARENIELVGRFYGLSKAIRQERTDQLLADLGLKDRADDFAQVLQGDEAEGEHRLRHGARAADPHP